MIAKRFHAFAWSGRATIGAESVMNVREDLNALTSADGAFCVGRKNVKVCRKVLKFRIAVEGMCAPRAREAAVFWRGRRDRTPVRNIMNKMGEMEVVDR